MRNVSISSRVSWHREPIGAPYLAGSPPRWPHWRHDGGLTRHVSSPPHPVCRPIHAAKASPVSKANAAARPVYSTPMETALRRWHAFRPERRAPRVKAVAADIPVSKVSAIARVGISMPAATARLRPTSAFHPAIAARRATTVATDTHVSRRSAIVRAVRSIPTGIAARVSRLVLRPAPHVRSPTHAATATRALRESAAAQVV
jgi:hypothetical protein